MVQETCDCPDTPLSFAHSVEDISKRAAMCRLLEATHRMVRAQRFFAALRGEDYERFDLALLSRVQKRFDGVVQTLSDISKDLKLIGVDKKAPFLELNGERVSLQEATRRARAIQTKLREKKIGDSFGDIIDAVTDPPSDPNDPNDPNRQPGDVTPTGFWGLLIVAVGKAVVAVASGATNDTTDDEARKLVNHALPEDLERMTDDSIVKLLNDLLDGSTGDEDERAILKILRALTNRCDRMSNVVRRAGLDRLLWSVDGEEWDELVLVLLKCRIIDFRTMDDDASRKFVWRHVCYQLSQLQIEAVHQLVLNMFSGGCGDDDEDAILKLVGCQSTAKLHQLIAMPGTDVGAFDYNFDGDQWDQLEALFAANGIVLDP